MRYLLVVPAAGTGARFDAGIPKQYAPLAGRTVIEWALAPFLEDERCALVMLALDPADRHWPAVAARLPAAHRARLRTTQGGAQRSQSVRNALRALENVSDGSGNASAKASDWVLVHDAARPCVSRGEIDLLLERLAAHPLGGLLALPLADTLKRADVNGAVEVTLERRGLWRAVTPQMFRLGALRTALDRAHDEGTSPSDEAQALEWTGEHPLLVEGAADNIKITTRADLALAESLLAARSCGTPLSRAARAGEGQ